MLLNGSETSLPLATLRQATLTNDPSLMSNQMISSDMSSVTFSPDLADGPMPCALPDGPMTDLFGQVLAPVSRSLSPATKKALTIRGISGRSLLGSSKTQDLQRSLANKLRARLTGSGSCEVIWTAWDTPWGVCLSKPRAQERTISGTDIGLWQTANVPNGGRSSPVGKMSLSGNKAGQKRQVDLQYAVRSVLLGLWPTATASDHKSRSASQATLDRNARPLREIVFALWSTIRATDGEKGGPNMSFGAGGLPLPSQVTEISNTSNAPTENGGGSLHPEFAGWEMGYPPEWINCAPSETRSTLARRRSS